MRFSALLPCFFLFTVESGLKVSAACVRNFTPADGIERKYGEVTVIYVSLKNSRVYIKINSY